MIQNCMVAVCDILGFGELVKSRPLDEIVDKHLRFLRKALYFAIYQHEPPTEPPPLQELLTQKRVGFAWFSDTFLFYSLEDTEKGHRSIIETVGWLLFGTIWRRWARVRAGVAYGELYVDQSNGLFVGRSLVDAYELEQKQEWSGGALTQSAVEKVPEECRQGGLYPWWVIPYPVPVKSPEVTFETLAINWTMGLHSGMSFRWSEKSNDPPPGTPAHVARKFKNTIDFHDQVCRFCCRG